MKRRKSKLYIRTGDKFNCVSSHDTYLEAIRAGQKYGRGNWLIDINTRGNRNGYVPSRAEQLPIAGSTVETSHIKRMVAYGIQNSPSFCSDKDN